MYVTYYMHERIMSEGQERRAQRCQGRRTGRVQKVLSRFSESDPGMASTSSLFVLSNKYHPNKED